MLKPRISTSSKSLVGQNLRTVPICRRTLFETTATKKHLSTGKECDLTAKKCVPCEGGVNPLNANEANSFLRKLNTEWKLIENGKKIQRSWKVRNFVAGIIFFEQIKNIAEEEGHHPDLHLTNYRDVTVDLWTHAIGGLSENDFIIAAKIDQLAPELNK